MTRVWSPSRWEIPPGHRELSYAPVPYPDSKESMRTADTKPTQARLRESSPSCSKGKDRLPRSDSSQSSPLKGQEQKKIKQKLITKAVASSYVLQSVQ